MTEYSADDFRHARFATHAVRAQLAIRFPGNIDHPEFPWALVDRERTRTYPCVSDSDMALAGWVPIREFQDPEDDERVQSWERLVKHDAWKPCYPQERPLIEAMIDRLDWLALVGDALDTTLARAMKAEWERDGITAMHAQQVKTIAELQREVGQARPDSITDEVVLRFLNEYDRLSQGAEPCRSLAYWQSSRVSLVRKSLIAALDDAQRPEGAESLDDPVAEALRVAASRITTRDEIRTVADVLADRGVRVVGDGS